MGELRELVALREDAAGWAREEARAAFRDAAGLPAESRVQERLRAHPLAAARDGLAQASELLQEALESEPPRPGRSSRLSGLRGLLLRARAQALEPGACQELREGQTRASVELHGDAGLHGMQTVRAIERELGRGRERGERADMEAALAAVEARLDGPRTACWEASESALSELEAGEPLEAAVSLHARGWSRSEERSASVPSASEPAASEKISVGAGGEGTEARGRATATGAEQIALACERLLAQTDALARDLGGWLLERHTGARPFPGDAERHDLLHLLRAPRCSPAFPRGELLRTCRRWAEGWRLDLQHGKAIRLDEEERALAREGATAVAIDPPDEVRVQLFPEEGPWALAQLLAALGVAQLYAGPPADAPPEDLLCHDPALPIASGAIFSGLLRADSFRRRCAKAELPIDDGRAVAVAHLFEVRIAAARTLASLEALRSGLSARAAQAHRELFARAALVALPSGLGLRDLDPFLEPWARLRGLAFAARTRSFLREKFDEDWWRNPRALGPLRSLWTRGGRPSLPELWSELAPGEAPSLEALGAELGEACA